MKSALRMIAAALVILTLSGCRNATSVSVSESGLTQTESTIPASKTGSSQTEEAVPFSDSSYIPSENETEIIASDSRVVSATEDTGTAAVEPSAAENTSSANTSTEPTASAPSASTPPSSTSSAPSVSQPTKPQEGSSSSAASSEAESKMESSAPTEPVIDIDYYINYAISYGQSIGLIYLPGQSESWNAPTIINEYNREVVEQEIRDGLDFKKNVDGWLYFHVWAVPRSDGKYELYGI